jgi:hypothetical protein
VIHVTRVVPEGTEHSVATVEQTLSGVLSSDVSRALLGWKLQHALWLPDGAT